MPGERRGRRAHRRVRGGDLAARADPAPHRRSQGAGADGVQDRTRSLAERRGVDRRSLPARGHRGARGARRAPGRGPIQGRAGPLRVGGLAAGPRAPRVRRRARRAGGGRSLGGARARPYAPRRSERIRDGLRRLSDRGSQGGRHRQAGWGRVRADLGPGVRRPRSARCRRRRGGTRGDGRLLPPGARGRLLADLRQRRVERHLDADPHHDRRARPAAGPPRERAQHHARERELQPRGELRASGAGGAACRARRGGRVQRDLRPPRKPEDGVAGEGPARPGPGGARPDRRGALRAAAAVHQDRAAGHRLRRSRAGAPAAGARRDRRRAGARPRDSGECRGARDVSRDPGTGHGGVPRRRRDRCRGGAARPRTAPPHDRRRGAHGRDGRANPARPG